MRANVKSPSNHFANAAEPRNEATDCLGTGTLGRPPIPFLLRGFGMVPAIALLTVCLRWANLPETRHNVNDSLSLSYYYSHSLREYYT